MRRIHAPTAAPRRRTASGLALALSALLASTAFAADDPAQPVSPAMRQALQRDLGLAARDLPAYLDTERAAVRRQAEARRALGASYAGSWLERDAKGAFRLVVATTQPSQAGKARALGAQARVAQYSLSQLEAAAMRLGVGGRVGVTKASRTAVDPAIHSWHIDVPHNRIVITTDPGATALGAKLAASAGLDARMVRLATSPARPRPTEDIRGGDRYNMPNAGCSVGFAVTHGGETGFATAGHCGTAGTQVSAGPSNYIVGTVIASQFPTADQAWVRNDYGYYWTTQPWTNLYNGGSLNVIGNLDAPVGAAICRSGATTGWRCGSVVAKNMTVNTTGGLVYGLTESTACGGFGDSGGSFVTPGGEAQGVYSAANIPNGSNDNCSVATRSWHYPVQSILDSYGLVLKTVQTCGRVNAGRVLPNGGSVTSCDGRFSLVIQGDGHLVLYKAGAGAIWYNGVFGSGHTLHMQTDGHLVVYNGAGQPVWYTGTSGNNGAFLRVQDDGNVVIYSQVGQPLWTTNTAGR